jgi:hypothetical protein
MWRLVVRALLFAALFLVLDRLVYAGAIFLRDAAPQPEGIDLIYSQSQGPEIVFFGDSRTHHTFDMQAIETNTGLAAYNFALDGASPEQSLFMLEEYLRNKHRPKIVVFEADPPMLDSNYGTFDKAIFRGHAAVVPDGDDLFKAVRPSLQQWASGFVLSWLARSASFPNRLPELWHHWRIQKMALETKAPYPCGRDNELRCADYNGSSLVLPTDTGVVFQTMNFTIDESRLRLYRYVADLAAAHHFWLVLGEIPRYRVDEVYPSEMLQKSEDFYCGLAKASSDVLYARLVHSDNLDRDVSLYYDWAHLNSVGARKVSQLIAPALTGLLHRGRPEPCLFQ